MNRKETTASLAIVSMALLATIMIATTPQALAIDYGSPDLNYRPSAGFVEDGTDTLVLLITLTKTLLTKNKKKIAQLVQLQAKRKDQKIVQMTKKIHLV